MKIYTLKDMVDDKISQTVADDFLNHSRQVVITGGNFLSQNAKHTFYEKTINSGYVVDRYVYQSLVQSASSAIQDKLKN